MSSGKTLNVHDPHHDQATMPPFTAKYSQDQRDAIAHAYEDRRIRPARVVVEMAAAGELEHKGEKLPPFDTNENVVRDLGRDLRKKRHGAKTSDLAKSAPRDAIETLRQRLVSAADHLLRDYERSLNRDAGKAEPERLRQIIRVVREAAALPGPNDPRPRAPGQKDSEGNRDGASKGMAGELLRSHRAAQNGKGAQTEPAPATTPHPEEADQREGSNAAQHAPEREGSQSDDVPGSRASAMSSALLEAAQAGEESGLDAASMVTSRA